MNRKQNETENLTYTSIDNLLDLLREVAYKGVQLGVPSTYIADYIAAETKTITGALRTGVMRPFTAIYSEFIDEVITNGRYGEFMEFLQFRKGESDVRLP